MKRTQIARLPESLSHQKKESEQGKVEKESARDHMNKTERNNSICTLYRTRMKETFVETMPRFSTLDALVWISL